MINTLFKNLFFLILLLTSITVAWCENDIVMRIRCLNQNGQHTNFTFTQRQLEDTVLQVQALDENVIVEWLPPTGKQPLQYCYQLANLDDYWINSSYPKAQFTNLKGGNYLLEICALQDSIVSPLYHLPFKVEKRVNEVWWFWVVIIGCIILPFLAIIYLMSMLNLRQRLNTQIMRNRIASDLHDDVGTTLDGIRFLAEMLRDRFRKLTTFSKEILEKIIDDARDAGEKLDDTVWAVRPNNDSVKQMIEKIRSCAITLLKPNNVELDFKNELPSNEVINISAEQRQNAYLIAKEAIHNIAKHSRASKAWIHIHQEKSRLYITIRDNGKGFDLDEALQQDGDGLKNYYHRAELGFIEFSLKTQPGEGVLITLMILES